MRVQSLSSLSGFRSSIAMSCGVGCRLGLDPALLWLWRGPAAAAPIRPLALEPLYAPNAALKRKKNKKENLTTAAWCTADVLQMCRFDPWPGTECQKDLALEFPSWLSG